LHVLFAKIAYLKGKAVGSEWPNVNPPT